MHKHAILSTGWKSSLSSSTSPSSQTLTWLTIASRGTSGFTRRNRPVSMQKISVTQYKVSLTRCLDHNLSTLCCQCWFIFLHCFVHMRSENDPRGTQNIDFDITWEKEKIWNSSRSCLAFSPQPSCLFWKKILNVTRLEQEQIQPQTES